MKVLEMTKKRFAVGTKIKSLNYGYEGVIIGHKSDGSAVLETSKPYSGEIRIQTPLSNWEEIKEPRKLWVVYRDDDSVFHCYDDEIIAKNAVILNSKVNCQYYIVEFEEVVK